MTSVVSDKIRVLLADDHAIVRESTRSILDTQPDMKVVGEASNGVEAVRLAQELRPDVIVMDIEMPEMNGLEATRAILDQCPEASVLVLTAHDDEEHIFALLEAGADGYVLKSARLAELLRAIRAVSRREPALDPQVMRTMMRRLSHGDRVDTPEGLQPVEPLTEREQEVLQQVATGASNKEIARTLSISVRTVQVHLTNIYGKLDVRSRTEAALYAVRQGWVDLG
jgi:DNA-binding NarL/FixJ family response regulator